MAKPKKQTKAQKLEERIATLEAQVRFLQENCVSLESAKKAAEQNNLRYKAIITAFEAVETGLRTHVHPIYPSLFFRPY